MGDTHRRFSITSTAALLFCLLALCLTQVNCTGYFEVRLHHFVGNGCCDHQEPVTFRICVKNYQAFVDVRSECVFGESQTQPYSPDQLHALNGTAAISFPFNFTWPGSFSFVIEAYRQSKNGESMLVSRFVAQRVLSPRVDWHEERLSNVAGAGPSLDLSYRVKCEANYYGEKCGILCKPRNDSFGHYTCDTRNGRRVCDSGWEDNYCDKAVCRPGCHIIHGQCKKPYECLCRSGWEGDFCDTCSRYPGCEHGTCAKAWQCNCDEGWGGLFCNEDLNYCTNNRPCKNGGTCTNTGQGSYTCNCSDGFMDRDCDRHRNPCLEGPCQNGGTCVNPSEGNYTCSCPLGFYGPNCETSASICTHNPCQNGGSCVHAPDGFQCACVHGFKGIHCEKKPSAMCTPNFCQNNGTCKESTKGPFCHCVSIFTGPHCEEVITCRNKPCGISGRCTEEIIGYSCECDPGHSGVHCEHKLHHCNPNPCHNGGKCHELATSYKCDCIAGYIGKNCTLNEDSCVSSPCRNGGTCRTESDGSYYCYCATNYHGKFCEYSLVPLYRFVNASEAVSNMSHQISDELPQTKEEEEGQVLIVLVSVGSLVVVIAIASCAICVALRLFRRRKQQTASAAAADEDEVKQNERNDLRMNNKCMLVPQNKIVNSTFERKVNNDAVKVNNVSVDCHKMAEKNLLYVQRTLERREESCGSGNNGYHTTQDWSPCPNSGVFIIQDHISPLKVKDCYQQRPPSLTFMEGEKIFATEV